MEHTAEPRNLVELFLSQAARLGTQTALRYKRGGAWHGITWSAWAVEVRRLALGFIALGLKPGETVSLLSNNRPEWMHVDLAVQMAGGILVSVYPTLTADDVRFINDDARIRFAVVEDTSQLGKLLSVMDALPRLEKVVLIEGTSDDPRVITLDALRESGTGTDHDLRGRWERVRPGDVAMYIYTSGTTARPKGAMLTNDNILFVTGAVLKVFEIRPDDTAISFLPLSHAYERIGGMYMSIRAGIPTSFAESLDKLGPNLLEVRPTILCVVPRVLEKAYVAIQDKVAGSGTAARALFDWALSVGRQTSPYRLAGRPLPPVLAVQHRIAKRLVYDRITARFGGRLRFIAVAGAPMSRAIAEFFHHLDLLVLEGYGMTECAAPATLNTLQCARFGTVGKALPGVEMKLDPDGEILLRGRHVFAGYFGNPEATAEALQDGWLHTGDIGEIDADGMLRITDRKKDIIVTSAGKNIAPQKIENLLIADPFIGQAVVIGDNRHYLTALVSPSMEAVARVARERGFIAPDRAGAASTPQVVELIRERLALVNAGLARFETIKDFRLLPHDLSMEGGELTPTLKLKRKVVRERFGHLIDEMYASVVNPSQEGTQ